MPAMPRPSNSVTDLPGLLCIWHSGDVAYNLMTGNDWKAVPEDAVLYGTVGMANPTGLDLDQNLFTSYRSAT